MKKYFLIGILFLAFISGFAQQQEVLDIPLDPFQRPGRMPGIYGKIVEGPNNKGVPSAAVEVYVKKNKPGGETSDSLVTGILTKDNGDFRFTSISLPDSFEIKITAVGFSESVKTIKIKQDKKTLTDSYRDLGNIKLEVEAKVLGTVTVVAQRPTLSMGIDRKVFNVDKNITSAGGTAIDVMRNIPSVTVDVEGNVQLRNISPQIYVDGRPTILTLQQIPADDIERVELITNPSAKFDAATTGGIINVVLKKNKRSGFNGVASAGIGTPSIYNGNLSLNLRQGKLNLFASGNYNKSGGVGKGETKRINKRNGIAQDYFNQVSETERLRRFTSVRFGADYFIDNRNTLTFSQNFVRGKFSTNQQQDQQYLNSNRQLFETGKRTSVSQSGFKRSNSQLNYKHTFPKAGQALTADVTYNEGSGSNNSQIANSYFYPDGTIYAASRFVNNMGRNSNDQLTIQMDYENPISETSKIEMGLRSFINNNSNVLDAFSLNNGVEAKLPLSTNVKYDEKIFAGYLTYSNIWNGIRYQAGLRAEQSTFNGRLVDSARKFGYTLPLDIGSIFDGLFPSLFLTKEIGDGQEIQLNFSRRIRRPNFWQLNPFIDINDPLNISQGNPALKPEYNNSFEFNYNKQYSNGSFLGVLYFHNNQADITRYSDTITAAQFTQLNSAAIEPNAILNTFINAQYTNRMGAEFTLQHKIGSLELVPNINLQYRKVKASYGKLLLSNEGFNWESKLNLNYKVVSKSVILNNASFQLSGEYESPRVIPQGRNKEQYQVDFALRKEFLKNNAAAITFAVNDVFNTNRFGQIYDQENYYQDSYSRWNVRNFRFTFLYRFGDKDFKLLNGQNRRRQSDDEENN
ncbi:MAG: outer membrane beta-barrel protein [Chitinophagaceae bacterium]